jgi:hypothetical protein
MASEGDLVLAELTAQAVPHTVVETARSPEGPLFVRLMESAFFCRTAVAEFE